MPEWLRRRLIDKVSLYKVNAVIPQSDLAVRSDDDITHQIMSIMRREFSEVIGCKADLQITKDFVTGAIHATSIAIILDKEELISLLEEAYNEGKFAFSTLGRTNETSIPNGR